jgi:hypothetical protein
MLKANWCATRWLLCCAVAPVLVGCTMMTPEWHPRRASASECQGDLMHYCVIDNYGKRCGCTPKQDMEAVLRSR